MRRREASASAAASSLGESDESEPSSDSESGFRGGEEVSAAPVVSPSAWRISAAASSSASSRAREGVPPEAVAVRERVFSCIIAGEAARLPVRRRVEFGMVELEIGVEDGGYDLCRIKKPFTPPRKWSEGTVLSFSQKVRSTVAATGSKPDFETVTTPAASGVRPAPARRVHTCTYRELWYCVPQ